MADKIWIGIDLGTSVLKAAAFDADGAVCAQASRELTTHSPAPGRSEQDAAATDGALAEVLTSLLGGLGERRRAVAGIGLAAQGGSSMLADRRTGRPLTPMVLWNDTRGADETLAFASRREPSFWHDRSYVDAPPAGIGRLLCARRDHADLFAAANVYSGAGDFVFFRLTGRWRQDPGHAIQIGWYNWRDERIDPETLKLLALPGGMVPPLRNGHETAPLCAQAAAAFGLPQGIPVAGPYLDHEPGYIAATGYAQRPVQCSLGTAWVANVVRPHDADRTGSLQLILPDPVGDGRMFCVPIQTGNPTLDWGLSLLTGTNDAGHARERADAIFAERLLPEGGLIAGPYFNLPNPRIPGAHGAGAFVGLSPRTDTADMLRALVASMVCEMIRVLEEMAALDDTDALVLAGGASKAGYIRTLFAGLLPDVPVRVMTNPDTAGARGTLYGINPELARCDTSHVERPAPADMARLADYLERYLTLRKEIVLP